MDDPERAEHQERVLLIFALLDELDRQLHGLGHDQAMSVGPALTELEALRNRVGTLARGYDVFDESVTDGDLKVKSRKYTVSVDLDEE